MMGESPFNLLQLAHLPGGSEEIFESLLKRPGLEIERIVSTGQTTPPDQCYDQAWDEWVLLLQGPARLAYDDETMVSLEAGDSLMIPAHVRHRVVYTSQEPPCVWLALHFK